MRSTYQETKIEESMKGKEEPVSLMNDMILDGCSLGVTMTHYDMFIKQSIEKGDFYTAGELCSEAGEYLINKNMQRQGEVYFKLAYKYFVSSSRNSSTSTTSNDGNGNIKRTDVEEKVMESRLRVEKKTRKMIMVGVSRVMRIASHEKHIIPYVNKTMKEVERLFGDGGVDFLYLVFRVNGKEYLLYRREEGQTRIHVPFVTLVSSLENEEFPERYLSISTQYEKYGVVENVAATHLKKDTFFEMRKIKSLMFSQLTTEGEKQGLIACFSKNENRFNRFDAFLLEKMCSAISSSMHWHIKNSQFPKIHNSTSMGIKMYDYSMIFDIIKEGKFKHYSDFMGNYNIKKIAKKIGVMFISKEFRKMFGVKEGEENLKHEFFLMGTNFRVYFKAIYDMLLDDSLESNSVSFDLFNNREEMKYFFCLLKKQYKNEKKIIVEYIFDITERWKAYEEENQVETIMKKENQQFISESSEVVHSFVTSLESIDIACRHLLENIHTNKPSKNFREILKDLKASIQYQKYSLKKIIGFGSKEPVIPKIEISCDLSILVNEIIDMFNLFLKNEWYYKKQEFIKQNQFSSRKIEKKPIQKMWIRTDKWKVQQILANLIHNAVKFTENGIITVKCEVTKSFKKENHVTIIFIVEDCGIGIKEEDQHIIMNKFGVVNCEKAKPKQGQGIGLYYSKKLATALGGKIYFTSEYGVGSKFYLKLKNVPLSPIVTDYKEINPKFSRIKGRIIFVEDDFAIREQSDFLLEGHNNFLTFSNGKDCIDYIREFGFDDIEVIISDIMMPFLTGKEMAYIIRTEFKYQKILLAATGFFNKDMLEEVRFYGFNYIISKPYTSETIFQTIESLREGKLVKYQKLHKNVLEK